MIGIAKIYFIIFGLLTIAGGVMGYVKAGSVISMVTGGISGVLLLVAAFLLSGNTTAGLIMAALVSLLLAGRFVPILLGGGRFMPAGMMSILSLIGIIVCVLAWLKK